MKHDEIDFRDALLFIRLKTGADTLTFVHKFIEGETEVHRGNGSTQ